MNAKSIHRYRSIVPGDGWMRLTLHSTVPYPHHRGRKLSWPQVNSLGPDPISNELYGSASQPADIERTIWLLKMRNFHQSPSVPPVFCEWLSTAILVAVKHRYVTYSYSPYEGSQGACRKKCLVHRLGCRNGRTHRSSPVTESRLHVTKQIHRGLKLVLAVMMVWKISELPTFVVSHRPAAL